MTIDLAKAQFDALVPEWTAVDPESSTESDTRFKIIDRMLAEVMGWERTNIRMEPHGESGYVDYLLSRGDRNCLVLEAKRKGRLLVNTRNPNVANYKLGGPALDSARDGIAQARKYCVDHGVSYSIVTTGVEWIFGSSQKSVHVERDWELKSMSSIRYLGVSTPPRYPRGNSCSLGVWSRQRSNCKGFE